MYPRAGHGADDRARFLREARVVARLKDPGIVQVSDYGEHGDACYVVMELVTGGDILIQSDTDYPGIASTFGWAPSEVESRTCYHGWTDGSIDCMGCGKPASEFIASARDWLDDHIGDVADDPGYF
jgi:hypothetical protein